MRVKWEFVQLGTLEKPGENEIAFDVGATGTAQRRVFDHHASTPARGHGSCSVGILLNRLDELDSLRSQPEVVITLHEHPDLDCAASSFVALSYLARTFPQMRPAIERLARIVAQVDRGEVTPLAPTEDGNEVNLYTVFLLLDDFLKRHGARLAAAALEDRSGVPGLAEVQLDPDNHAHLFLGCAHLLFAGVLAPGSGQLQLLDLLGARPQLPSCASFLEAFPGPAPVAALFRAVARFVGDTVRESRRTLRSLVQRHAYAVLDIAVPAVRPPATVLRRKALAVTAPYSVLPLLKSLRGTCNSLFPEFRETELSVLVFEPEEDENSATISMAPRDRTEFSLRGLGLALDRANNTSPRAPQGRPPCSRYWHQVGGMLAPDPLFEFPDPWYDGRAFDFTIVVAPRSAENRNLSRAEIRDVVQSDWARQAAEYETREYRDWQSGAEMPRPPKDDLFLAHLMTPLAALLPLGLRVHARAVLAGLDAAPETAPRGIDGIALWQSQQRRERGARLRQLLADLPQLARRSVPDADGAVLDVDGALERVRRFAATYREICRVDELGCPCPQENRQQCGIPADARGAMGWCPLFPYPHRSVGCLPDAAYAQPTAYELLDHQLQWLQHLLHSDGAAQLAFLREELRRGLRRFFAARDLGRPLEIPEVSSANRRVEALLIDSRLARHLDYILEELEYAATHLDEPLPELMQRVNQGQRFIGQGLELLEQLDGMGEEGRQRIALFAPFLANLCAFFEALDRMLKLAASDRLADGTVPETMLQLAALGSAERARGEPGSELPPYATTQDFTQNPFWSCAVLGPRIVRGLYLAAVRDATNRHDYGKATALLQNALCPPALGDASESLRSRPHARVARRHAGLVHSRLNWVPLLAVFAPLLVLGLASTAGASVARWLPPVVLVQWLLFVPWTPQFGSGTAPDAEFRRQARGLYRGLVFTPFLLKIVLGIGILAMAEMDYALWTQLQRSSFAPALLVNGGLLGLSISGLSILIRGACRWKRAVALFAVLFLTAELPALAAWYVRRGDYGASLGSFLFLVLGGIFFAVVVSSIGRADD